MGTNLSKVTNFHLISILKYDNRKEAWEQLKLQNPTCEELETVLTCTDYCDEAWDLLKEQNPTKEVLISVMKWTDKKKEAGAFLLEQGELDNDTLNDIVT